MNIVTSTSIIFLFVVECIVAKSHHGHSKKKSEQSEQSDDGPSHDQVYGNYAYFPKGGFPKEKEPGFLPECVGRYHKKHPFLHTSIPDIITESGYEFEEHKVTSNGYILTVFRIPGSPASPSKPGKIPMILNHGTMGNALSWLFLKGNKSLGFKLADAGYDMFLMNYRGSYHSKEHEIYNTSSDEYWNYTMEDKAVQDIPAIIDYVLNLTGQPNLYYAGHSQGTIQMVMMLCEKPEYADKIRVNFFLSPAMYIQHGTSPGLNLLLSIGPDHRVWKKTIGNYVGINELSDRFGDGCAAEVFGCSLCENLAEYIFGNNAKEVEPSLAYFFNRRYFDTASTKSMAHVAQFKITGRFQKYQYPTDEENMEVYGTKIPPEYDYSKYRAPTVVFWGYSDEMVPKEDVKKAMLKFPQETLVEINRVQLKSFMHVDFLYAKDVNRLVYDRMQWIMDTGKYVIGNNTNDTDKLGFGWI